MKIETLVDGCMWHIWAAENVVSEMSLPSVNISHVGSMCGCLYCLQCLYCLYFSLLLQCLSSEKPFCDPPRVPPSLSLYKSHATWRVHWSTTTTLHQVRLTVFGSWMDLWGLVVSRQLMLSPMCRQAVTNTSPYFLSLKCHQIFFSSVLSLVSS